MRNIPDSLSFLAGPPFFAGPGIRAIVAAVYTQMQRLPLVTAHDGCEGTAPHTLRSIRSALAAGADVVEIDIRLTQDGVVVLEHDAALTVDGERLKLCGLTFEELERCQRQGRIAERGPEARITRLEEVLAELQGGSSILNLDVKEDEVVEPALQLLESSLMRSRVVFSGCEPSRARRLSSHHQKYQVLLNADEEQYRRGSLDYEAFVHELCEAAVDARCCGVNVYHTFCREQLIDYAARRFLPVSAWTVDEPQQMRFLLDAGVHSITTHRVSLLRSLMGST